MWGSTRCTRQWGYCWTPWGPRPPACICRGMTPLGSVWWVASPAFSPALMLLCLCSRGIYREILFLTMAALGKDHVDIGEGLGRGLGQLGRSES